MNKASATAAGRRTAGVAVLLGAALLLGCETTPQRNADAAEEIDRVLEDAMASQPAQPAAAPGEPPEEVRSALLPSISVDPGATGQRDEQRFEISVRDTPAQQFFMSLVEGTRYNLIVHPGVEGSITLELKNVTIPEVMEVVRNVYGYEFERSSYGYEVLPARLRSRIYQVNYLNVQRSGISRTRVSSGQITATDREDDVDEDDDVVNVGSDTRSTVVSGSQINTLQPETTFWLELEVSLAAILGDAPGRVVVVNPQSGIVVVRAMPQELREVESFLSTVQATAVRQVILEAKILEVELSDRYQQGINWAGLLDVGDGTATVGQVGGGTVIEEGASLNEGSTGILDPDSFLPILGTAASSFGGVFTLALALDNFNAFIELLETQGTVHVLSSPRISTMNNQKAVIKVGSDEFFVTNVSSTTVTGTTTTTTPSVELTPFFSGIALDVTPQISEDGDVMLHVHPSISEVIDQQKQITVGSLTQVLPLALSTVRESDSIVKAESGQVVVIGGLMQNRAEGDAAKSPGLGDAPVAGSLFRQSRQSSTKSELVILLRPMVVQSGKDWVRALRDSSERIRSINTGAGMYGTGN